MSDFNPKIEDTKQQAELIKACISRYLPDLDFEVLNEGKVNRNNEPIFSLNIRTNKNEPYQPANNAGKAVHGKLIEPYLSLDNFLTAMEVPVGFITQNEIPIENFLKAQANFNAKDPHIRNQEWERAENFRKNNEQFTKIRGFLSTLLPANIKNVEVLCSIKKKLTDRITNASYLEPKTKSVLEIGFYSEDPAELKKAVEAYKTILLQNHWIEKEEDATVRKFDDTELAIYIPMSALKFSMEAPPPPPLPEGDTKTSVEAENIKNRPK